MISALRRLKQEIFCKFKASLVLKRKDLVGERGRKEEGWEKGTKISKEGMVR